MFFLKKKSPKHFVSFQKSTTFASHFRKRGTFSRIAERKLGYGVIGNTTDSGPVIPGSSPGIPTTNDAKHLTAECLAFICFKNWRIALYYLNCRRQSIKETAAKHPFADGKRTESRRQSLEGTSEA